MTADLFDCPVCGRFDLSDDEAWRRHCAHVAGEGFDADDFPDEPGDGPEESGE